MAARWLSGRGRQRESSNRRPSVCIFALLRWGLCVALVEGPIFLLEVRVTQDLAWPIKYTCFLALLLFLVDKMGHPASGHRRARVHGDGILAVRVAQVHGDQRLDRGQVQIRRPGLQHRFSRGEVLGCRSHSLVIPFKRSGGVFEKRCLLFV